MNDNRYSPPSARVADADSPGSRERPVVVTRAVYLLWASFVLTLPGLLYLFLQPDPELSQTEAWVITFFGIGLTAAFATWLNTAAWNGRGYARWVMAVLTVLGVAGIIWTNQAFPEEPPSPWYIQVTDALAWITTILGNGMLFAPSANAWYRAMRASR